MANGWQDLYDTMHEVPHGAAPFVMGCLVSAFADATCPVKVTSCLRKYIRWWKTYDNNLDPGREDHQERVAAHPYRADTYRVSVSA